jgi:hypothetical protein
VPNNTRVVDIAANQAAIAANKPARYYEVTLSTEVLRLAVP